MNKMTREDKINEIVRLFDELTPEGKEDFTAAIEAIKTRSLDNAPESFKAFLRLPEQREFAKTFH